MGKVLAINVRTRVGNPVLTDEPIAVILVQATIETIDKTSHSEGHRGSATISHSGCRNGILGGKLAS